MRHSDDNKQKPGVLNYKRQLMNHDFFKLMLSHIVRSAYQEPRPQ